MKKTIFAVFLFLFVSAFVFSYDGTLWGGYSGNQTRYNFIQQFSSVDFAQSDLRELFGNNVRIQQLYPITEDDVDEEDVQMLNDHAGYLQRNFRINNGDVYAYFVRRTWNSGNVWTDGWIVYSHYSSAQGWLRYLYYFKIG